MEDLGLSFSGRSAFVTGHTGFKGSWLSLWLCELGAKVVGFSLPPPTQPSNFEVSQVAERLAGHILGDIRDRQALSLAMREARPDLVIHMAAQPLVRESYAQPAETFETNVQGTVNVLEAVRQLEGPCQVIVVTSDKCYENAGQLWGYRETDRMGGRDPYSASKGAAELTVRAYRESFFNPAELASHGKKVASVRAGNVIGGGDWAKDRLVGDLVRAFAAGETALLRTPRSIRPWQHVLDAVYGYLILAARMARDDAAWLCEGWNFGPDQDTEWPVERLAASFCAAWPGARCRADAQTEPAGGEAITLRLDSSKARLLLGWRPRWNTDQAVRHTVSWYRRHYAQGGSMRQTCLDQIKAFTATET
jgi:CDP-glucose 4,6-dehydratase